MTAMTDGLLHRFFEDDRRDAVSFTFDGARIDGLAHDTILAAILRHCPHIGTSEFDGTPRAGFCLMGSCQECTLWGLRRSPSEGLYGGHSERDGAALNTLCGAPGRWMRPCRS